MRRSPYLITSDLKEVLCTYLETAYKISNQTISDERAQLLREHTVVSQSPFIETTPRFQQGKWLNELKFPQLVPELDEFARIGLPVGKFPLYWHQEEAIRLAWDETGQEPRDLIVASGTGSGKTEIFYLTILADLLKEALSWPAPRGKLPNVGHWEQNEWIHRRHLERRPAATRAIILYPMNALVNDQLRRLRKMLTTDFAIKWQNDHLHGNRIFFGRYTSQTLLPGLPKNKRKRQTLEQELGRIQAVWQDMGEKLQALGNWPHLEGPEMLCRWDMQAAPPDILLTNYSMLEYMLVRPIEKSIFKETKDWLRGSKNNIFTLVLDEAHTYSGTRGTEVAYLIRRLFERLDVAPEQVRCIATSASLGSTSEELIRVKEFAANLFSHPKERFSIIEARTIRSSGNLPTPTLKDLRAFANFQDLLSKAETDSHEVEAVNQLLQSLEINSTGKTHIDRLYSALEKHPMIIKLRDTTARNATQLDKAADEIWGNLADKENREKSTAGLLAAGALARSDGQTESDVPPLLPSRIHTMFRGIPGLWACINPKCNQVRSSQNSRPCGKLYVEPRIWCECGARVVELLSCRVCGLLFGGGIEENGSIWPYENNLEGGTGQYDKYEVFALENPGIDARGGGDWPHVFRNIYTTGIETEENASSRMVWERADDDDNEEDKSSINSMCPRCGQRVTADRKAIEPLRTTGAQAFSTLMEHAFRLESPHSIPSVPIEESTETFDWFVDSEITKVVERPSYNPNLGRKALAFSDSRQNAARLAGDLVFLHYRDLFRQLILKVLNESNEGEILASQLIDSVFNVCIERGIDPTFGEVENFWLQWDTDPTGIKKKAEKYLDTFLRREIADRQVGVEALGLARWVTGKINPSRIQPIPPLNQEQTSALINTVLRILASENVILPRSLDPQDWPSELLENWYKRIITIPPMKDKPSFEWAPPVGRRHGNRLTKYIKTVLRECNSGEEELPRIMYSLWENYLYAGNRGLIKSTAGVRHGFGIPITLFSLARLPAEIYMCRECKYISVDTVNGICLRCYQVCEKIPINVAIKSRKNYYRLLSDFASDSDFPDPFPLRAYEHTAQISANKAADRERYFQDQFFPETSNQPESPLQHGVDILSVTTTMEMGIDIGDLTVVGLHNTPPTVANYQQRAGRAGRRSDGVAEVLTFSRQSSHDQYYYNRVAEIVTGQVRIPTLYLQNPVIAQRHFNALVLQKFFSEIHVGSDATNLLEAFGKVDDLIENREQRLNELRNFLCGVNRQEIVQAATRILADINITPNELESWIDMLPTRIQALAKEAVPQQLLLDLLIEKGLLPRYAFPVDVVALWTKKPSIYTAGEEVQRDLSIALSDYAPGAEVIIDGYIYKSAGLYTPFEENPKYEPTDWYYECPVCHYIKYSSRHDQHEKPNWLKCDMCHTPVNLNNSPKNRIMPAIEPKGFRTEWKTDQVKYRGGGQDKAGYASPAQLAPGESAENGQLTFGDRLFIHRKSGDLYVVNRGLITLSGAGFLICPKCGTQIDNENSQHYDPVGGHICRVGTHVERSALLHHFNTDTVLFGTMLDKGMEADPSKPGGRATWLSMGTALRQGAAAFLQIDPEELNMGIRPWYSPANGQFVAEVFLYDTLPNGAGYATEVAENASSIFNRAIELVSTCPTPCETACYRCLLDYKNQLIHPFLDRHLAGDILNFILTGNKPTLDIAREKKLLNHLEQFARKHEYQVFETINGEHAYATLRDKGFRRPITIWPLHTLLSPNNDLEQEAREAGIHYVFVSQFDLIKRPFWVWENLGSILRNETDDHVLKSQG